MRLAPGTKLGPYEIAGPVGAGGMGEVYRARDTRLQRDVAVKLLPAALAGDAAALRRLEQEARTLAALNHPSLLTIFDTGALPDGAPYLVCELLEGETLRARLQQGPLPVRQALGFGAEVAQGLAAAHGKGIVHRDLKPENLFCTADGRIKILDFGLAKLTEAASAEAGTLAGSAGGTAAGLVLGTVGYMAPEQARGQAADARSDIFALGAVLYEMLSGRRAFAGDSAADVISAILREEPAELELANPALAAPLERIVRHCLEKAPARRFQSADDLAFALDSVTQSRSTTSLQAAAAPAAPHRRRMALAGAGTLGLAAAVALTWWFAGGRAPAAAPRFHRLTYREGVLLQGRFLPDGQTVMDTGVFAAGSPVEAFTLRLDSPGMQPLGQQFDEVLAVNAHGALVLQQGHKVVGYLNTGTLALMPLGGSAPRALMNNIEDAAWAPGGSSAAGVAIVRYDPRRLVTTLEYPAGKVLARTGGWFQNPRFSRDGTRIAFIDHTMPGDDQGEVEAVDLNGRVVVRGPHFASVQGLAWSPGGREIWFGGSRETNLRSLFALTLAGKVRRLLSTPNALYLDDVLANGAALVRSETQRFTAMGVTAAQPAARDISVLDWPNEISMSADGKWFLVGDEDAGARYGAYLEDAAGTSPPVRLGDGDPQDISSDDRWALSHVPPAGGEAGAPAQLWLLPTGAGAARQLTHGDVIWHHAAFVPGRRLVIAIGNAPGQPERTYLIRWDGSETPILPAGVAGTAVTPDGKAVLAHGPSGWALYPLAGGAPRPVEGIPAGAAVARISADGTAAFAVGCGRAQAQLTRVTLASGARKTLATVNLTGRPGVAGVCFTAVSADGKSYAYNYVTTRDRLNLVTGLH